MATTAAADAPGRAALAARAAVGPGGKLRLAAPNFIRGTKAHAVQVQAGFDATGAFLGITATCRVTLPDGTLIDTDFIWNVVPFLSLDFLGRAQNEIPQAVRNCVAAQGCDYG